MIIEPELRVGDVHGERLGDLAVVVVGGAVDGDESLPGRALAAAGDAGAVAVDLHGATVLDVEALDRMLATLRAGGRAVCVVCSRVTGWLVASRLTRTHPAVFRSVADVLDAWAPAAGWSGAPAPG